MRHRKPRFLNRSHAEGWLPPSLKARVRQVESWIRRYRKLVPVSAVSVELAKFDTRKLENPKVSGVEYRQGELFGYEVREYLLGKWERRCAYCGAEGTPLQVEHIVPRSRGGSDRIPNLTLACGSCNLSKGSRTAGEFGYPGVQARAGRPMRDAAAMNTTRWAVFRALAETGLPVETGTGGRTKHNRARLGLPKEHVLDAACVGASTPPRITGLAGAAVLMIQACGRGRYQRTQPDASGFPKAYRARRKRVRGFATGDLVRAHVRSGTYEGSVIVRHSGYFDLNRGGRRIVQGVGTGRCELLQRVDGYTYETRTTPIGV